MVMTRWVFRERINYETGTERPAEMGRGGMSRHSKASRVLKVKRPGLSPLCITSRARDWVQRGGRKYPPIPSICPCNLRDRASWAPRHGARPPHTGLCSSCRPSLSAAGDTADPCATSVSVTQLIARVTRTPSLLSAAVHLQFCVLRGHSLAAVRVVWGMRGAAHVVLAGLLSGPPQGSALGGIQHVDAGTVRAAIRARSKPRFTYIFKHSSYDLIHTKPEAAF